MSRINSRLDTGSDSYRQNHAAMTQRVEQFRERLNTARNVRPQRDKIGRAHV